MRTKATGGALVDYRGRHPGPYAHTFCGPAELGGAACRRCGRPLVALLSLDARDPLAGLVGLGLPRLPLLFCWGCPPSRTFSFYRLSGEGVTVLRRAAPQRAPHPPYRNHPAAFPAAPARLIALPAEVEAHHRALNRALGTAGRAVERDESHVPRHQVGGEPLLLARSRTVTCPHCRKRMAFVATIADDCLDPRGFTGNRFSQVLFHLCRPCHVVGAYRQQREPWRAWSRGLLGLARRIA